MSESTPWHVPGKWHAVPAFWDAELQAQFPGKSPQVQLLDCTMAEGPDAVGCHLGWKSCIDLALMLDDAGVGAITSCPSRGLGELSKPGVRCPHFAPYPYPCQGGLRTRSKGQGAREQWNKHLPLPFAPWRF